MFVYWLCIYYVKQHLLRWRDDLHLSSNVADSDGSTPPYRMDDLWWGVSVYGLLLKLYLNTFIQYSTVLILNNIFHVQPE